MVEFRKLSRHTGAEILGIDLAKPLAQSDIDEIWKLFVEHTMILFRGQQLDQAELVTATGQFGKVAEITRPKEVQTSGQKKLLPLLNLSTCPRRTHSRSPQFHTSPLCKNICC